MRATSRATTQRESDRDGRHGKATSGERGHPLALLLRSVQLFYNSARVGRRAQQRGGAAVDGVRRRSSTSGTCWNGTTWARGCWPDTQQLAAQGLRLREGTIVNILDAPASTKNRAQARDPEMHQVKKGNQWYFGMKAHIGVDAATGLVHLATTAANVADITRAAAPPRRRDARERRRGIRGGGPALEAPSAAGRHGPAPGAAAALGRQRRRPQQRKASTSSEGRASISLCEATSATHRSRGLAKNRTRLCLLLGFANLLLAERAAPA